MILKILHTNDVHSNYENFAKIVTLIKEYKDEGTIILDAGDPMSCNGIKCSLKCWRGKCPGHNSNLH